MKFQTAKEIEIKIANYFGIRTHLIVPNLSWGMLDHECDLAILSTSDYLYEVEIKVSRSDLIKDREKNKWRWQSINRMIRKIWFAIPEKLVYCQDKIPEIAGILVVSESGHVSEIRKPKINRNAAMLSLEFKYKMARLGTMRIWGLKKKLLIHK